MMLNGIDFGPVWTMSGAEGFFGEGYWFHRWLRFLRYCTLGLCGFGFSGATFVSKTTTLAPRAGNMLLSGIRPLRLFPDCVVVRWWKRVVLNSISLSGPGVRALFDDGRWQQRTWPFFISFMSVAATASERIMEFRAFIELLREHLHEFRTRFGIQLNLSCPNVDAHGDDIVEEARELLDVAKWISSEVPIVVKLSIETSPRDAMQIAEHRACAAIHVSNTVKWGRLPHLIDWKGLFGTNESPLAKYGGGGLSGAPLLPLVASWVVEARGLGLCKPINAGGGILCAADVDRLYLAGARGISIGSMAILSPWNMRGVIRRAHELFL